MQRIASRTEDAHSKTAARENERTSKHRNKITAGFRTKKMFLSRDRHRLSVTDTVIDSRQTRRRQPLCPLYDPGIPVFPLSFAVFHFLALAYFRPTFVSSPLFSSFSIHTYVRTCASLFRTLDGLSPSPPRTPRSPLCRFVE